MPPGSKSALSTGSQDTAFSCCVTSEHRRRAALLRITNMTLRCRQPEAASEPTTKSSGQLSELSCTLDSTAVGHAKDGTMSGKQTNDRRRSRDGWVPMKRRHRLSADLSGSLDMAGLSSPRKTDLEWTMGGKRRFCWTEVAMVSFVSRRHGVASEVRQSNLGALQEASGMGSACKYQ